MRTLSSSFALAASLICTVSYAQHRPHQAPTDFPYRCPKAGICLEAVESDSIVGGVRHVDDEIRFHAFYRPAKDSNDVSPYCVVISTTDGNILASDDDRAECDDLQQNDQSIFGRKPTTIDDAKRNTQGDDATRRMVSHLVQAESQPDHFDAWVAVQTLAQRWLTEQDRHESSDESK